MCGCLGDDAGAAPVDRVEEDLGVVLQPHGEVVHLPGHRRANHQRHDQGYN